MFFAYFNPITYHTLFFNDAFSFHLLLVTVQGHFGPSEARSYDFIHVCPSVRPCLRMSVTAPRIFVIFGMRLGDFEWRKVIEAAYRLPAPGRKLRLGVLPHGTNCGMLGLPTGGWLPAPILLTFWADGDTLLRPL